MEPRLRRRKSRPPLLLIEKYPEAAFQAQALSAHLKAYAYAPWPGGADPNRYGAGILDIVAALALSPCETVECYIHPEP